MEMFISEGQRIGDIEIGDLVDCTDGRFPVEQVAHSVQPCVQLGTDRGHCVIVSTSTPFTLRNGNTKMASEMDGEDVVTDCGSGTAMEWLPCKVSFVGVRSVAMINLGGRTFAAGEDPKLRIYSHNYVKG